MPDDPAQDNYERFVRLFTRHEAAVRAFVRAMMPRPDHCDEIMQEVSIVAWRKFDDLATAGGDEFCRWACTIARFEVLKHRRRLARDRLVLDEDVLKLLADEALDEIEVRSRQREALDGCLKKLKPAQRELVIQAYSPGPTISEIAAALGKTRDALYQALRRIRAQLLICIERSLERETGL